MKAQKVRHLLAAATLSLMLAVTLVAGNVRPAAAQTWTPMPIGCYFQGKTYPLGTVLHFFLPEPEPHHLYMRCELNLSAFPGGAKTKWAYYSSNPS